MAAGTSPVATYTKDPVSTLDYTISWKRWLGDDLITAVLVTVPAGIGNAGVVSSATTVTVWLSGGTAGTGYSIQVQITTASGRIDKRTFKVNVIDL